MAATDLDAGIVDVQALERREQQLNRRDTVVAAVAEKCAVRSLLLQVAHVRIQHLHVPRFRVMRSLRYTHL